LTDTTEHRPGHEGGEPEPEETVRRAGLPLVLLLLAVGYLAIRGGITPILVIIALLVMIFLHELGHYLTAKAAGMKVTEFFLGFGPKIWSFQRGETEYGAKVLPLGAYVKIIGMNNLDEVADPADEPRTYRQKPYWRRMSVALAGSTMHFLIALTLLWVYLVGFGVQKDAVWHIDSISKLATGESPAQQAGLKLGDRIVAIDGKEIDGWDDARVILRDKPGAHVSFTVLRDGKTFQTSTDLADRNPDGERVGFLGIHADFPLQTVNPVAAVPKAFGDFGHTVVLSGKALGSFFTPGTMKENVDSLLHPTSTQDANGSGAAASTPKGENRLLSPVGAVRIASQAADEGFSNVLALFIGINIFVGLFNLIPLLPFDGGHVAIATYERIREIGRGGRRYMVDVSRLLPVTYLVVFILGSLALLAFTMDIVRPIDLPTGQ
jgi:membrane-associated protease RseP (regulator of RpoE activity)